jgi:hypothetical protein
MIYPNASTNNNGLTGGLFGVEFDIKRNGSKQVGLMLMSPNYYEFARTVWAYNGPIGSGTFNQANNYYHMKYFIDTVKRTYSLWVDDQLVVLNQPTYQQTKRRFRSYCFLLERRKRADFRQ